THAQLHLSSAMRVTTPSPSSRRRRNRWLGAVACVVWNVVVAEAQSDIAVRTRDSTDRRRPMLRVSAPGPIRVDGVLAEGSWSRADSIVGLSQIEPREGAPASALTVVRVLASEEALVVGIRADQPANTPIVAFARERDAVLTNEDHVRIVIDTYLDGRSGYVFAVNANGARYDGLVGSQGE